MKIRNGFVSNSSSSSFIILGVKLNEEDIEAKFGEDPYDAIDELDLKYASDDGIIGMTLATVEEGGFLEETEHSIEDLYEKSKKVAALLKVKVSDIKIYTGMESC